MNLSTLLATMEPELSPEEYVFCSVSGELSRYAHLEPVATVMEAEGLTLILTEHSAKDFGLEYSSTYRRITLQVHSSLDAAGLTAAISERLTSVQISANVVAGYYHDHIFVPSARAEQAVAELRSLSQDQT